MNEESIVITPEVQVRERKNRNVWRVAMAFFVVMPSFIFWSVVGIAILLVLGTYGEEDASCNVARIPVQGILTTTDNGLVELLGIGSIVSADNVIEEIKNAEEDDEIDAIVLDIDSPGGTPVSADEIMTELLATKKPTVSVIRDRGTSAAYWVAVGTDHIIASPVSDVGSIGVTMSYLESASSTDNSGSRWIDLSSGLFKDAGNPDRALRDEEEEYFQTQVDTVHEYMLERILLARTMVTREELEPLADGRAFLGAEAIPLKLIDELGSFSEARNYIAKVLSKSSDEVELCSVTGGGLEDLLY